MCPSLRARLMLAVVMAMIATACGALGPKYEYEEQLYLGVNGAATVMINASVPALVALRGVALDPSPNARIDQADVRRVFEEAGCSVVRVGQPWRREGRRFVQVRLETDDVRKLASCRMLDWSTYTFERDEAGLHFVQRVGAPAAGDPGAVKWTGAEIVGFKLHAPSRVTYHNIRRLKDGEPGNIDRGNILTWEQRLSDRRAGAPVSIEIRMETQPILYRTLWLFGGSFLAALAALGLAIILVIRRGRSQRASASPRI